MPDVERVLVEWLGQRFPVAWVCTETPAGADFTAALPIIQVLRIGGGNRYSIDAPTVVVDCFGAGRGAAKDVAYQVRDAMYWQLPGVVIGDAVVGGVGTISGPAWRPWDNTTVRRFDATYQIHLKAS